MGRDPWRPPAPDSRGNPGAVLYETQKVAIVEMMGQTRGNFHRLLNTLGAVLLHPNEPRASAGNRLNREYGIRDIIMEKSLGQVLELDRREVPNQNSRRSTHALEHVIRPKVA